MTVRSLLTGAAITGTFICGVLLAQSTRPSTASPDLNGARFRIIDARKGPFLIESGSGKTWFLGTTSKWAMGWLPVPLFGSLEATATAAARSQPPPPKDPAQAPAPQSQSALERTGYIRRKLELSFHGHIGVAATIQDRPVNLLVDTGAPNTYLDRKCTDALGIDWNEIQFKLRVPAKSRADVEEEVYLFTSIMLGDYATNRVRIRHFDLAEINAWNAPHLSPKRFDGLLGTDVLDRCSAVIDFKTHDIYLMKRGAQVPPLKDPAQAPRHQLQLALERDGYIRRKLDLSFIGFIGVAATIQDRPVNLLVDTGSPNTYLDRERTDALGIAWKEIQSKPRPPTKARGNVKTEMYLFTSIMLGDYETNRVRIRHKDLSDVNATMAPHYRGPKRFDGILGTDVLDRCSAVIDFKTHDIYLMRRGAGE